ncbi:MAG: class I SAM-dependent methyltransferase [Deltaproteobacteria bacterium]|nr:class I SAM-dependent methyltransferase [Deltaproteobacteria bacterium]
MSADPELILEVVEPGHGIALDLGGRNGELRAPLRHLGYSYVNMDICPCKNGEPSLIGDAHCLPFRDRSFELVLSKDTLEHFLNPWTVVHEVHRILKDGGQFVIWVPFMHPFHGDDFYRYSPLGLRRLLGDFEIITFESPLWAFTIVGLAAAELLKRLRLGFAQGPIKRSCSWLDRFFTRRQRHPASFAAAYRIVACKKNRI